LRIGIISDVHGNVDGLLAALDRMGEVDELLCAGDIVEQFRFSNDAVEVLRTRGARCVLGNHDLVMLSPHGERARAADHVRPELVEWLAEQPHELRLDIQGKQLLMTHASPFAPYTEYIYPHSPELARMKDLDVDYVVIGHTHTQMVKRVGRPLVINPGSVGQARDHSNGRQLSYAVLDTATDEVVIDDYLVETETQTVGAPNGR
jgi:putative phosphoesterase